jgi:hypothetical protein
MAFNDLIGKFLGRSDNAADDSPVNGNDGIKPVFVQFYLCFPNQTEASEVRDQLEAAKLEVILRLAEDYFNWLVVVIRTLQPDTPEFAQFEADLAALAESSDGEYQGWEYLTVLDLNLYSAD